MECYELEAGFHEYECMFLSDSLQICTFDSHLFMTVFQPYTWNILPKKIDTQYFGTPTIWGLSFHTASFSSPFINIRPSWKKRHPVYCTCLQNDSSFSQLWPSSRYPLIQGPALDSFVLVARNQSSKPNRRVLVKLVYGESPGAFLTNSLSFWPVHDSAICTKHWMIP